jgi:2,3-bisphosphoglycerate-independent phosphoglycerate mutase
VHPELIDTLVIPNTTKIVFLIMDGLGGLPGPEGMTELETAQTPNLDALAKKGICGLLDPVGYGITPGSGPAHFALFGYDPVKNNIGRGILEGAGIDFPMAERDLLIRINFATIDSDGIIVDRRAGRIDNDTNRRICQKLQESIPMDGSVEVIFQSVKEHRAVLILRGDNLAEEIQETDPQHTGMAPLPPRALVPEAKYTESILSSVINRAKEVLSQEPKANMMLLRGYAKYRKYPSLYDRYRLNALAIASYPMYRGIARLLGMNIARHTETVPEEIAVLREN